MGGEGHFYEKTELGTYTLRIILHIFFAYINSAVLLNFSYSRQMRETHIKQFYTG